MLKEKTVFVLGAGASKEVGMPIGIELLKAMSPMLDFQEDGTKIIGSFDRDLYNVIRLKYPSTDDQKSCFNAARTIKKAIDLNIINSIDEFLDTRSDNDNIKLCGKLAIVKAIVAAEKESALYQKGSSESFRDLKLVQNSWMTSFFKLLQPGISKKDRNRIFENVSFVVFNYDRCLEHFLVNALMTVYNIAIEEAAELIADLKIYRPYGSIGPLPWQTHQPISAPVQFGGSIFQHSFIQIATSLKTYTEQIEEGDELNETRELLSRVSRIVFLGFAFHKQNVKLLCPAKNVHRSRVFGTALDFSENDIEIVSDDIWRSFVQAKPHDSMLSKNTTIENCTCSALFQRYKLTLLG